MFIFMLILKLGIPALIIYGAVRLAIKHSKQKEKEEYDESLH